MKIKNNIIKKCYIAGSVNCGKTSLYNYLTSSHEHVGNREGVTVSEVKKDAIISGQKIRFCDLPGIVSLPPKAKDEQVTYNYICSANEEHDSKSNRTNTESVCELLLLTISAQDISNGIKLISGLLEKFQSSRMQKKIPNAAIAVITKCDLISCESSQLEKEFSALLGIPCVAISLHKKYGLDKLKYTIANIQAQSSYNKIHINQSEIENICYTVQYTDKTGITPRSGHIRLSGVIEKVCLSKPYGYFILVSIIILILYISFGKPANILSDLIELQLVNVKTVLMSFMARYAPLRFISGIVCDGIFDGFSALIIALPGMFFIFASVAALESIGYTSYASNLTDKFMRRSGLSGDSFIPVFLGLGCTVSACLCTRSIECEYERRAACLSLPFISCSARVSVYTLICRRFFPDRTFLICALLYLFTFLFFILYARIFSKKTRCCTQIRKAVSLTLPSFKNIMFEAGSRICEFLKRAGMITVLSSILVWSLGIINIRIAGTRVSALEFMAYLPSKLLSPIGLGNEKICASLIAGIASKESIVSTISALSESSEILGGLTQKNALQFIVFSSMYCPCSATIGTISKETCAKDALLSCLSCFTGAYICTFAVNIIIGLI